MTLEQIIKILQANKRRDSYEDSSLQTCKTCGLPWVDHLGVTALCSSLHIANEEIASLKAELELLKTDRDEIIAQAKEDLRDLAAVMHWARALKKRKP
jgi:hypothetical protein